VRVAQAPSVTHSRATFLSEEGIEESVWLEKDEIFHNPLTGSKYSLHGWQANI
jgi:hypothetical protein